MKKIPHIKQVIIIILTIALLPGFITLAKFVSVKVKTFYLNSKNFYFSSNRLAQTTAHYEVNNWSGFGSFDIAFNLRSKNNELESANYDIPYEISYICPVDTTCQITSSSGTIYQSNHEVNIVITVTAQRRFVEDESVEVYVEATSQEPYEMTLSGTFEFIVGKEGITYEISDAAYQKYLEVAITNAESYCTVISNFTENRSYQVDDLITVEDFRNLTPQNQQKCISKYITLSFDPNIFRIDTTSNIMNNMTYTTSTISGVSYINTITFPINPSSSLDVKFYKLLAQNDYTYPFGNNQSAITVTVNDVN